MLKRILALLGWLLLCGYAQADGPKVAVTDLAYEEKVSEYIHLVAAHEKSTERASGAFHAGSQSLSAHGSYSGSHESDYFEMEGTYTYIDRGELRKFTSDIKGEMLKSGLYRVTQGRPYTAKNNEKLYDVIDRIKKGQYPGADYVLFGSISSMEWRNEGNPVAGTNKATHTLSLELVADFSLVNTRTYEVKAAFSATGEGQDVRFLTGSNVVVPSRGKVVAEVSKSLGADVARQLEEQFRPGAGTARSHASSTTDVDSPQGQVIILK